MAAELTGMQTRRGLGPLCRIILVHGNLLKKRGKRRYTKPWCYQYRSAVLNKWSCMKLEIWAANISVPALGFPCSDLDVLPLD